MILLINTAESAVVFVGLLNNGILIDSLILSGHQRQSDKLLALIDKILRNNKVKLATIKGIAVVKGPGSFTSLRIGVVVANTLAWSLKLPILGVLVSDFESKSKIVKLENKIKAAQGKAPKIIEPVYGAEPNITLKK
nr:tRNA (adenosine(37)-N6)-threonylcarbamoyltransferase complex dimerization subunit type 1 TsaB [Patescibacteria group bacterium]